MPVETFLEELPGTGDVLEKRIRAHPLAFSQHSIGFTTGRIETGCNGLAQLVGKAIVTGPYRSPKHRVGLFALDTLKRRGRVS